MKSLIKTLLLWTYAILHPDRKPKIVFYHDIGTKYTPMGTDLKIFKEHLKILEEVEKRGGGGERNHLICFDDGFRGAYDHRDLLPRGTKIFIAPRLVGQPGYLTWDEIRTLNREYGIDFQSHTWSHQTLVGPMIDESPKEERTEEWYKRELVESREKITDELDKDVDELCFPVGYFTDELIERCKKAGYKKVYASYPGDITHGYVQSRCLVQDLSPMAFNAALKGGMMVFAERYFKSHKREVGER